MVLEKPYLSNIKNQKKSINQINANQIKSIISQMKK